MRTLAGFTRSSHAVYRYTTTIHRSYIIYHMHMHIKTKTKSTLSKSMQPSIPPLDGVGHFLRHKFTYPANQSDCKTVVNIIKI